MTSRSSKSAVRSFETEIEKCREEGNWKRSVELATQLKARSAQHESLAHFLIGEGELEQCLEEWNGSGGSGVALAGPAQAHSQLQSARSWLQRAAGPEGRRAGVALDALLLLAKLEYAMGDSAAALHHYDQAELSTLTEKELPVRSLRIVAESFAIRALCLEERGESEEAARCGEVGAALAALWAQRGGGRGAGPLLGAALAASLAARDRARAAEACRALLSAVEAPALGPLRLGAARELAELLLRSRGPYRGPGPAAAPSGPWKPRRYAAPNQFTPAARQEEALLAALLAEAMAARDAVLSQSPEFAAAREHALRQAVGVADLLAILTAKWGLLCLLHEALERAMKFSFGVRHVWRQRALVAAAAAGARGTEGGQPAGERDREGAGRACAVLRRACALAPGDAALRLVAARSCRAAGRCGEAIEWAEQARAGGGALAGRAAGEAGAAWQARAAAAPCRRQRAAADCRALALLQEAARLDPADHWALHRLALQLARCSRLNEALDAARACLWARPECPHGLRLAAALWSAAGAGVRGARALAAARLAADQYPGSQWPLAALGALLARRDPAAALSAGRALVALAGGPADGDGDGQPDEALSARLESAGSSHGAAGAGAGAAAVRPAESRRAAAWLALAQLLVSLGRAPAAAGCVAEAAALAPNSHLVFYTRGLVQAAMSDWSAAKLSFTDALALQPTHADSLLQLGGALYALGWPRLAEGALRAALSVGGVGGGVGAVGGGVGAVGCRGLATVLWALHEPQAAADAAACALAALPATPALPLPLPQPSDL